MTFILSKFIYTKNFNLSEFCNLFVLNFYKQYVFICFSIFYIIKNKLLGSIKSIIWKHQLNIFIIPCQYNNELHPLLSLNKYTFAFKNETLYIYCYYYLPDK